MTRKRKTPGELREVLAQNVNRLMEQRYRDVTNRALALAKDSGMSLSSVQRTLSREQGASIDKVEALAKVLIPDLPAFQLLVPWGLLGEIAAPARRDSTPQREPLFRGSAHARRREARLSERKRRTTG